MVELIALDVAWSRANQARWRPIKEDDIRDCHERTHRARRILEEVKA